MARRLMPALYNSRMAVFVIRVFLYALAAVAAGTAAARFG